MPLGYQELREAFAATPLFEDKTWRFSPEAWPLTPAQFKEIGAIGQACLDLYRVTELLYSRAREGRNILRNQELRADWVADDYDRGKPERLLAHSNHPRMRNSQPAVIRPDLLVTDEGFALTEVDSVPGGVGLTAFLNRLYGEQAGIIGAGDAMVKRFYEALAALRAEDPLPLIGLIVSDEAQTYRPEMEWLAAELRQAGNRVYTLHPADLMPLGEALCADVDGDPVEIDVIYRFWELFDLPDLPVAETLMDFFEAGAPFAVTPPMRPFQEEKLTLALFHHPRLQGFWRENLSKRSYRLLQKVIPRGWVMDPVEVPPNAVLDAPPVGGQPIHSWQQLAGASQKERNLILKLSGFHENAWGARSVLFGSDASREEWADGLRDAEEMAPTHLHLLQEYRKPARRRHPVYRADGTLYEMEGRVRLCPYYFVKGQNVELAGVLATFCPADKKIIHGMRDAALLPCRVVEVEA